MLANNRGLTLIESMIGLSLMTIGTMAAIQTASHQMRQQRNAAFHSDLAAFEGLVRGVLSEPHGCGVNFGAESGHPLWLDLPAIESAQGGSHRHEFPNLGIVQPKRVPASDPARFEPGPALLSLQQAQPESARGRLTPALRIRAAYLADFLGGTLRSSDATARVQATLVFEADKQDPGARGTRSALGAPVIERRIPLRFVVDRASGNVISCAAVEGGAGGVGATGIPLTQSGSGIRCPGGTYLAGVSPEGTPECRRYSRYEMEFEGQKDRQVSETSWGNEANWEAVCPLTHPAVASFGQAVRPDGTIVAVLECEGINSDRVVTQTPIGKESPWGPRQEWRVGCDRPRSVMTGAGQSDWNSLHPCPDGYVEDSGYCRNPATGATANRRPQGGGGFVVFAECEDELGERYRGERLFEGFEEHYGWGRKHGDLKWSLVGRSGSVHGFAQSVGYDYVHPHVVFRGP